MTSTASYPNAAGSSRDAELVPRASYILAPLPRNDPSGLRGQLRTWSYKIEQAEIFLSILLGHDQTPDESVTGNERVGVSNYSTDHDPFQPRSRELDSPRSPTFWLPEYLERRVATPDYTCADALKMIKTLLDEVMKFGARATDLARVFARLKIDLVEHLLHSHLKQLRPTLRKIVKDLETEHPLIDPLLQEIVPSDGFVSGAPYVLEPRLPMGRVGSGALSLVLRYIKNVPKQFDIFISILRREDQPPDEGHDSPQPHGGEPVPPTTTVCTPEIFCWKLLVGPFKEVLKFGPRATAVAKAFARMEFVDVEYLLAHPEHLRATLQRLNTITAKDNLDTPNNTIEDEIYFDLAIFYYFGTSARDQFSLPALLFYL